LSVGISSVASMSSSVEDIVLLEVSASSVAIRATKSNDRDMYTGLMYEKRVSFLIPLASVYTSPSSSATDNQLIRHWE